MRPEPLTVEQQLRYARHLVLPQFGAEAQRRLLASSVLLVGAGGLGSPTAFYLAAAGIGRMGVMDDDVVDLSNLHRQILHRTSDTGTPKVESARRAIKDCNPDVAVEPIRERLSENNARELIGRYDVVVDGTDNFPTRYLINDAAFFEGKPVVHGSIYHYEGQASVFDPVRGPCYRCLFPDPPAPGTVPSCAEAGVLGVLPGIIGLIEATETIKLLTGIGDTLAGRLLTYDALGMSFRTLRIRRNPACPLCGDEATIKDVRLIDWACDLPDPDVPQLRAVSYREVRDSGQKHLLLDVRETSEVQAGHIEGCRHIPVGDIAKRIAELEPWRNELVVCQCQSGVRSQRAAEFLRKSGFRKVVNMAGGYLAWLELLRRGEAASK